MHSSARRTIRLGRIEKDLLKKEGNIGIKVAIRNIFKAIYKLFQSKKDASKENIVNVAKKESIKQGLEGRYNWDEIFNDLLEEKVTQNVEQQKKVPVNENLYPNNFYAGQAIGKGNCFFDSFRQGLEQQKGIKVTVEQLRMDCFEFAFSAPEWFIRAIANSYDNAGERRNESPNSYAENILSDRWGDPEVEGRILCEKYCVKLHVAESNPWHNTDKTQDQFLHQLVDNRGSNSVGKYNRVDYSDDNILHVINKGGLHFEPLLSRNKNLTKQPQVPTQEQQLVRQLQEKKDQELAKYPQGQEYGSFNEQTSQEKSDRLLAMKFQSQEYRSFNEQTAREESDRLLAMKLQGQEYDLLKSQRREESETVNDLVKKEFPRNEPKYQPTNCSMERVRLTQHRVPSRVK